MSTNIRPEVSERNQYWISKHRYYELKHFCLQYNSWVKAYKLLDGTPKQTDQIGHQGTNDSKPTEQCAIKRTYYADRISMVRLAAKDAAPDFSGQLLKAVTEGLSYDHIRAQTGLSCSKDAWYEFYRKFFWLLDKARE